MAGVDSRPLVLIRGAGDLATGVAYRLARCGFGVVMTERAKPLAVRVTVSFSSCIPYETVVIEGVYGRKFACDDVKGIRAALDVGLVAVLVDPDGESIRALRPNVLIDGRVAKVNIDTRIDQAPLVIGLGPGFTAGVDCHAVIETNRGHDLGRVIWSGGASPDTGIPASVNGKDTERVLRAPHAGTVYPLSVVGMAHHAGDVLAHVDETPIRAPFDGVLRGLIDDETPVGAGTKIGDLDPRARRVNCFTISDKSLAIGGGVLEAILSVVPIRKD